MKEEEDTAHHDDPQVIYIVDRCLDVMERYSAQTQLTASINLLHAILRIFCVGCEKKEVLDGVKKIYKELKKGVEENFYE